MKNDLVLEVRGLTKRYGGIVACQDVDFDVHRGTLTAIVGDNGAGKSTLLKILTGAVRPDEGTVRLNGEEVKLTSPIHAHKLGIEVLYQELALAPNLDTVSNMFLGREIQKRILGIPGFNRLDTQKMCAETASAIERLHVNIPSYSGVPIGRMSGGQRQSVAIARSVHWLSHVLFMDEPTAALGHVESVAVLELVKTVLKQGVSVVMVSHILPHVVELADHVIVMQHGKKIADLTGDVTAEQIIKLIVGA